MEMTGASLPTDVPPFERVLTAEEEPSAPWVRALIPNDFLLIWLQPSGAVRTVDADNGTEFGGGEDVLSPWFLEAGMTIPPSGFSWFCVAPEGFAEYSDWDRAVNAAVIAYSREHGGIGVSPVEHVEIMSDLLAGAESQG